MATQYYAVIDNKQKGPFTKEQLLDAELRPNTLVWFEGCTDWLPANQVAELARLFAAARAGRVASPFAEPSPDQGARYPEAYLSRSYRFATMLYALMIGAFVVCLFCHYLAYSLQNNRSRRSEQEFFQIAALACSTLGYLLITVCLIVFLMFLYRAWALIQDGHTSVSPGRSVGFLFIPIFQFVWVFVAVAGLPRALNRYADRHQLIAPRASVLLGLALCIYFVLAPIPYLGAGLAVLNLLLLPMYMTSILRTANSFCEGNERFTADDEPIDAPMATPVAWYAGLTAIILPIVAMGLALVGYVGAIASQNEWKQRNNAWIEKIEGGPKMALRIEENEQAKMNAAESWIMIFVGVIGLGVLALFLAIVFAIIATRSNAKLEQSIVKSRHRFSEPVEPEAD